MRTIVIIIIIKGDHLVSNAHILYHFGGISREAEMHSSRAKMKSE